MSSAPGLRRARRGRPTRSSGRAAPAGVDPTWPCSTDARTRSNASTSRTSCRVWPDASAYSISHRSCRRAGRCGARQARALRNPTARSPELAHACHKWGRAQCGRGDSVGSVGRLRWRRWDRRSPSGYPSTLTFNHLLLNAVSATTVGTRLSRASRGGVAKGCSGGQLLGERWLQRNSAQTGWSIAAYA